MARNPARLANCSAKMETPPVPCKTVSPGTFPACRNSQEVTAARGRAATSSSVKEPSHGLAVLRSTSGRSRQRRGRAFLHGLRLRPLPQQCPHHLTGELGDGSSGDCRRRRPSCNRDNSATPQSCEPTLGRCYTRTADSRAAVRNFTYIDARDVTFKTNLAGTARCDGRFADHPLCLGS